MLCKVCGAQIPDDARECEFCGAITENEAAAQEDGGETKVIDTEEIKNIEAESVSEHAEEKTEEEEIFDDNERRRREQMKRMMENKKKQLSEIERRRNEKRIKQRRNRIILVAVICALAIAAAGIGAYYVVQNVNSRNEVDATPIPTATAPAVTPSAMPTMSPSPELSMTTAPKEESTTTENTSPSWTASESSSGSTSSGTSASGGNTSGNRAPSSSGTSASGGSSSTGSSSSAGGSSSVTNVPLANASNSGVVSNNINAKLSTGGEVIYNSGTGRYLMTFVSGTTKYYATVSEGSTTEQINNKLYTITAIPTSETYNGNTVYDITSMTGYDGNGYILENSGTKLLTENDIKGLSKYDLALARNEIYARHGRKFQTVEYSNYFSGKSWYKLNPNYNYSDDNSNLNEIESQNVQFLLNAEKRL